MIKNYIKKVIAVTIITTSIIALNPVGASAAWKEDKQGRWYTEGNSYAKGWRQISNRWYYFDDNGYMKTGWFNNNGKWYYLASYDGYMVQNAWMCYGYYLNSNGEWTDTSKYRREDIMKGGMAQCKSGMICYEAGDQSNLSVINNEPCIYTWDKNDIDKYIGMNTLDVYDSHGNKVDKVVI